VEPYVVRFWETEFSGLAPKKSDTGQRLFRRKDVELLLQIKHLLYEKKFTIEGARQALVKRPPEPATIGAQQSLFAADPIPTIRQELRSLLELLK
jgi:DNA-binding transcriptional MerR regulator